MSLRGFVDIIKFVQIVLHNVPAEVEQQLAVRAQREGKTVDQIAVALLAKAVTDGFRPQRDLSFMRMSEADALEIEAAHKDFENIDPEAWK